MQSLFPKHSSKDKGISVDKNIVYNDIIEPRQSNVTQLKNEIIAGELADVILLLDYLSGRSDRSIAGLLIGPTQEDLVGAVFAAHWPPSAGESDAEIASAATTMLKARDQLNELAYPASGASIAFTIMATGEDQFVEKFDYGKIKTTRQGLAARAYPRFQTPAKSFRLFRRIVFYILLLVLLITSLLSWNVAIGYFSVNQIASSDEKFAELIQEFPTILPEAVNQRSPLTAGETSESTPAAKEAPPQLALLDCTQPQIIQSGLRACMQAVGLRRTRCIALFSLALWYDRQPWHAVNWLLTGAPQLDLKIMGTKSPTSAGDRLESCVNAPLFQPIADPIEQISTNIIQVDSAAILPMCYGLLGALAAICLAIYRKTKESTLMPRDHAQMRVQALLGTVVGGCIGLFLTPTATISSLGTAASNVTLSASAISFLAGLGVERVFKWLEAIIMAVFGGGDQSTASAPRQPNASVGGFQGNVVANRDAAASVNPRTAEDSATPSVSESTTPSTSAAPN